MYVITEDFNVCHCESFAAAGYAHKGLEFAACAQTFYEPVYGFRLVAGRLILIIELELCHLEACAPILRKIAVPKTIYFTSRAGKTQGQEADDDPYWKN